MQQTGVGFRKRFRLFGWLLCCSLKGRNWTFRNRGPSAAKIPCCSPFVTCRLPNVKISFNPNPLPVQLISFALCLRLVSFASFYLLHVTTLYTSPQASLYQKDERVQPDNFSHNILFSLNVVCVIYPLFHIYRIPSAKVNLMYFSDMAIKYFFEPVLSNDTMYET